MADEFDSPWKEALERFLEPFFQFFFPAAHEDIDWQLPVEHLDAELRKVVREAEHPNRRADHLVKVSRRSGGGHLVLVHLEIQNQVDRDLSKRMFTSMYRIYDRFDLPVVGIAVLGARAEDWDPSVFGWDLWGTGVEARFRTVQLLDYNGKWSELQADPNPFALVVQAYLKTQETKKTSSIRREWKIRLIRHLYERDYSREEILELFRLIDWMMVLPETEAKLFQEQLGQLEEELSMPYVTSVERLAKREGLEQGMAFLTRVLRKQLVGRFGDLPDWVDSRLAEADGDRLERWGQKLITAPDLDSVFEEP